MIALIDYGMGNVGSILNMLKRVGGEARITSLPKEIEEAEKLILPGVGAFDTGMLHLQESGLVDVLNEVVLQNKKPVLGICLGMQLFTQCSEEGKLPGLGWIAGETVRFRFNGDGNHLKIPHMGWNTVAVEATSTLFRGLAQYARFYFVHSYHLAQGRASDVTARTHYGYEFASAVECGNILGTQFHPEKSHKYGMRLLQNFVELA